MVNRTCNRLRQNKAKRQWSVISCRLEGRCTNKANFPPAPGGARPQGRGTRVRLCETKPIWGGRAGPRRGKCAKQTQFPPLPGGGRGSGHEGRGAMVQNKANWAGQPGPWRAKCAKQDAPDKSRDQPYRSSIFAQKRGSETDSGTFVVGVKQTQFLPLCRSGDRRSRESQSCKTNPISALVPIGRSAFPGSTLRTVLPNWHWRAGVEGGRIARVKIVCSLDM